MRIALVAPFGLRAKGTARARALPLGKAFSRRGHTVALFVPPYDSPTDSGRRWEEDGVAIRNAVLPGKAAIAPFWHVHLAWRLLYDVRSWHPDVVHVFKPKGPSGLAGAILWWMRDRGPRGAKNPGHPGIVVDSDDWEGAGGWNDDPRAGYSALQRRFFAWQERFGLSHADAWTVASACLAERALALGATPGQVFVLPNGITGIEAWLAAAQRTSLSSGGDGRFTALLYTRFAGVRVEEMAALWREVVACLPDARLAVVGRGLAGEETRLAGLAPNVDVLGWIEPANMPALFGHMSVALVPWADTPANRARNSAKVLELMAAGLPLVAYRVGELPSTLDECGVLVPPGEQAAFVQALVALWRDRTRARTLGAAARARVQAAFTWDHLAETALAAYQAASEE